eukprot:gb/GECG01010824.1/.p1 GENE.gb/GECG01010824.1/~~gb/GECG01010824.1/.p1  ORF type:complete len:334 (+),score=45.71 gb/GECG01010824.1/:1-1002(+)
MEYNTVVNVDQWIEQIKPELKPPVGNKMLFGKGQHKVMIVGGPNTRADYHIEEGEELFYMIKGDMCLKVMEQGKPRDIPIREGEMFLLPRKIPHSPQREADTIGLVIERERRPEEKDGLRWYVQDPDTKEPTGRILYQEWFHCEDLGTQLKPIIERFFASEEYKTNTPSKEYTSADQPFEIDTDTKLGFPFSFQQWVKNHLDGSKGNVMFGATSEEAGCSRQDYLINDGEDRQVKRGALSVDGEFRVDVNGGDNPKSWEEGRKCEGEVLIWQMEGIASVKSKGEERDVPAGHMILLPKGTELSVSYKKRLEREVFGADSYQLPSSLKLTCMWM